MPSSIFSITTDDEFEQACLSVFYRQAQACEPYGRYLSYLGVRAEDVRSVAQIPFLPIEFFKTERVVCGSASEQVIFTSSGTTGADTSRHYVTDVLLYEESFLRGFEHFYGHPQKYCILALLPVYAERQGSSLVYMVERLMRQSAHPLGGFFLHNHDELAKRLELLHRQQQQVMLIGVSFALLDLAERYQFRFPNLIVMETGGMKGRRRELPREELHRSLCSSFGVELIHSEYGMTELLSQAYSRGGGRFSTPPWMRVALRDLHNPFAPAAAATSGGINVIDLANQSSCAFIETQDLGRMTPDGTFEVLGRIDHAMPRGCNMLI
ncbi:MAG: acyltransferase [Prevotellaceae bacterium]|jgi:phenylacetate-coenzyme A ligase PaaK-like adenylate-forming protein|nr:acyltransferase [Prevotellaceae bacterium]